MNAVLELQSAPAAESVLARARVHRKLTTEEAARRAGVPEDHVRWLEEGRVYRFPSPDHALLATLLYATALGIDHDEALALAGREVPPRPLRQNPWPRLAVLLAIAGALVALSAAVVLARGNGNPAAAAAAQRAADALPAPWAIHVVVLNGSGDINYTRQIASRIGGLGYALAHVGRADNFGYRQTAVYFPPGGEQIALRLAKTLGVETSPLPGGTDPRRLVVIVGPQRGLAG
jgi:transcriptional regulator with XRE-family HTH domain